MRNTTLDPPTSVIDDIRKEVADIVLDPDRWLITPNCSAPAKQLINSGYAI
jgi:hypothetical protein